VAWSGAASADADRKVSSYSRRQAPLNANQRHNLKRQRMRFFVFPLGQPFFYTRFAYTRTGPRHPPARSRLQNWGRDTKLRASAEDEHGSEIVERGRTVSGVFSLYDWIPSFISDRHFIATLAGYDFNISSFAVHTLHKAKSLLQNHFSDWTRNLRLQLSNSFN